MSPSEQSPRRRPVRREPPRYRRVEVRSTERLTPRLTRVVLGGAELEGLTVEQPAASVRLLIPSPGERDLVMPEWDGNQFVLPGGERPTIRTFTPRRVDPDAHELELWIVVHGDGAASRWADAATPGDPAAVSGPGRGYTVDPDAPGFLLAGDETALAAIAQLLETLPAERPVEAHVEVADPDARLPLPEHPRANVEWHELAPDGSPGDALVAAVRSAELPEDASVWAAGEAAAVQRIRRHLFDDRGMPRSRTAVRGYWKHGRRGT